MSEMRSSRAFTDYKLLSVFCSLMTDVRCLISDI